MPRTAVSLPPSIRLGVDVGGTFTDIQVLNEKTGRLAEFKTPTTPSDPSAGVIAGLKGAAALCEFSLSAVRTLMHGTTIATNAVLEHKVPLGVLVTTSGFEDVLEIARHDRENVYSHKAEERYLLVPRERRFGIRERVSAAGQVVEAIDESDARSLAERIATLHVQSVAICLLNAYANPDNERRLRDILAASLPRLCISVSSDVNPEIREYERMSTTVLNALLMPVVRDYLARLADSLKHEGMRTHLYLVQSNGGMSGPDKAAEQPARLLISGPCGGAIAAAKISRDLGEANVIAVDMGGTSFDVSVICNGRIEKVAEAKVEGIPVRLPMVEIRTIGAGGGSIAWIDASKRLLVGPQSAGADPGPACYSRGGTEATVTDANLVLSRIDASRFLGGEMRLDLEKAREAVTTKIASPLGMTTEDAAEGVLAITVAKLAGAVKLSLFEKGLDPQDFVLLVFGGAGGLHGAMVAHELGINRVIFPRNAGTLSACGMLWSDIVHDVSRSFVRRVYPEILNELNSLIAELMEEGTRLLVQDEVTVADRTQALFVDLRYLGQGFELTVPWDAVDVTPEVLAAAIDRFHELHLQRFSHNNPGEPVEIVTVRLLATGTLSKPGLQTFSPQGRQEETERRTVYFDGGWHEVPVFDRESLRPGHPVKGAVILLEDYSTIFLPPGWSVEALGSGDLMGHALTEEQSWTRSIPSASRSSVMR